MAIAMPSSITPRPDDLKRVYTGITLTKDDLASVLRCFRESGRRTSVHANSFQLHDLNELEEVLSEDKVIDRLSITAQHPTTGSSRDGQMKFFFDFGYVLLEANDSAWSGGFDRISSLLDAIPKNGTTRCSVSVRHRVARSNVEVPAIAPVQPEGVTITPNGTPILPPAKPVVDGTGLLVRSPAPAGRRLPSIRPELLLSPMHLVSQARSQLRPAVLWAIADGCLGIALIRNWSRLLHGMDPITSILLVLGGVFTLVATIAAYRDESRQSTARSCGGVPDATPARSGE